MTFVYFVTRYDFFLVSQLATQGTVSPTMYNVIEDSTGLKPEYIQRLSYKLTHLYFNCTVSIFFFSFRFFFLLYTFNCHDCFLSAF